MSNRHADPDREPSSQLFVAEAKKESAEKALTPATSRGGRGKPEWSPDGKWIALLEGDDKKYGAYGMEHLALVAADGSGAPLRVTATEDARSRRLPAALQRRWQSIYRDRDRRHVRLRRAHSDRLAEAPIAITDKPIVLGPRHSAGSCAVALSGDDSHPSEVYAASLGRRQAEVPAAHASERRAVRGAAARDDDRGQRQEQGRHRGPRPADDAARLRRRARRSRRCCGFTAARTARISISFAFERQWFAANGYAVLAVNYRGSAGRGAKYSQVDLGRLGPLRSRRSAGDGRPGRQDGRRRSEQARRRRLELRRHPHRLHDRQRHALQGGDQRRRHRVHRRLLRHRSVHHPVRLRDRPAVGSEGVGDVSEDLVPVPARRPDQDADAVPRRREGLQRAGAGRRSRCTRRCAASASTRSW